MDVTIGVATFGGDEWVTLARERAVPSAMAQGVRVIHRHAGTLAQARNLVLQDAQTEFVVHLDADDELAPGYIETLAAGTADVRAPSVRYIRGPVRRPPVMPRVAGHRHACSADCLPAGNWLVVGSMMRAQQAIDVGGWREFEWSEDWDLFLRLYLAGASFEAIPSAVYVAHVRPDSRNRAPSREHRLAQHEAIYKANFQRGA